MYYIEKDFTFSASHRIDGLPKGHPCGRLHGHNYVVRVRLQGIPDKVGFVRDYNDLDDLKKWIDRFLDHQSLNDETQYTNAHGDTMSRAELIGNPTAENLARMIFDRWRIRYPELVAVSVSETPKTWATYFDRSRIRPQNGE